MKKLLVIVAVLAATSAADASEYGCKVLLCLANPASNGGPKGVAECAPPIDRLYDDLRRGRAFPTCDLADGNNGASYARPVYDPYDPCPVPLQPVTVETIVVQGQPKGSSFLTSGQPQMSGVRSGTGRNTGYASAGPRACVGKFVAEYRVGSRDDAYVVQVFDRVVWQQPQNPNAIDVFVDGKWSQRVRW